jgi:hypothetical protein
MELLTHRLYKSVIKKAVITVFSYWKASYNIWSMDIPTLLSKLTQVAVLLICIWKVPRLNLWHFDRRFLWFSSDPPGKIAESTLNRAIIAPFHIFSNPINHRHTNGYTIQPSDSIRHLHVAFPNFVLAIYFQIKCSSCSCKASTQRPELYAAVKVKVKCSLVQALRLCTGHTVKCTLVQALRLCTGRTVTCTLVQALRLCTGCIAHRGVEV